MNYLERLHKLRLLLPSIPCDALLVEHPVNLFYLTGIELSTGKLIVSSQEVILIVDGRYFETCLKRSPYPVQLLEKNSIKDWLLAHQINRLAFESDKTTHHAFLTLQKMADELIHPLSLALIPVESPVQKLRFIKDENEIQCLKEAAALAYEGYQFVESQLQEGIKECELALELEFFWKKKGAKKLAFDSIIAFGVNSSMPHYRAGETKLTQGMHVLIDIGVVWKHYHSDMTRVLFFGPSNSEIKKIYEIVDQAKQHALSLCKPGVLIGELDLAARDYITSKGYGDYFIHSLGHGLGLDIHEPPTIRAAGPFQDVHLQPGMAITIEPGIYLPNLGGVRLEDTVIITVEGHENLTKC